MSSMTRAAIISILALSAASTGAAQLSPPPPAVTIHTYPQSSPYLTPVAAAPYAYTPSYASSAVAGAITVFVLARAIEIFFPQFRISRMGRQLGAPLPASV